MSIRRQKASEQMKCVRGLFQLQTPGIAHKPEDCSESGYDWRVPGQTIESPVSGLRAAQYSQLLGDDSGHKPSAPMDAAIARRCLAPEPGRGHGCEGNPRPRSCIRNHATTHQRPPVGDRDQREQLAQHFSFCFSMCAGVDFQRISSSPPCCWRRWPLTGRQPRAVSALAEFRARARRRARKDKWPICTEHRNGACSA